jgi:hypothetical protein
MGVVYLARQPALDRLVVLKKMRHDLVADPSMVERFQREARAAAAVHHQNVVAVYDCFSVRDDHFIAQEFVDGQDLRTILDKVGKLEANIAQRIALEIIRGLEEIHARGIVHRDLKPANILIGRGGEAKVADFGIALEGQGDGLTRPGTLVGSIPYMSPEQMLGERIDFRSDLFLFGILLYEMLTGKPPFRESNGDSTDTLLERMQGGRYDSPRKHATRLPGHLVRIIRSCLRPKPSRRIRSATAIRRRLERRLGDISPTDCRREIASFLGDRGLIESADDSTMPRGAGESVRGALAPALRRWLPAVGAVVAATVVGFAGYFLGLSFHDEPVAPREPARSLPMVITASPPRAAATPPTSVPEPVAAAPAPRPAHVRFVAYPWAEVRIDDRSPFQTPCAEPVVLEPGRHRVVFEHPAYGRAEEDLDLAPGEDRVVRHAFPEAPRP